MSMNATASFWLAALLGLSTLACAGPAVYEAKTIRVNGEDFDADDEKVDGILLRAGTYERAERYLVLSPREEVVLPFTSPTESAIQFIASINHTDDDR
jgi:hypothetical protein